MKPVAGMMVAVAAKCSSGLFPLQKSSGRIIKVAAPTPGDADVIVISADDILDIPLASLQLFRGCALRKLKLKSPNYACAFAEKTKQRNIKIAQCWWPAQTRNEASRTSTCLRLTTSSSASGGSKRVKRSRPPRVGPCPSAPPLYNCVLRMQDMEPGSISCRLCR